jgi:hypothetical protein
VCGEAGCADRKELHKAHEIEAGLAWVFAMAACWAGSMLDLHLPDKPGFPLPPS